MKEKKELVPDLIDRIADPADVVVRAARAGLRSLTGKDFGPNPGSDDAANDAEPAKRVSFSSRRRSSRRLRRRSNER